MKELSTSFEKNISVLDKCGYFSGDHSQQINMNLRRELIFCLNQLYTSDLSRSEVYSVLETSLAIGGKGITAQQRILQLSETISWLEKNASSSRSDIREQFIIDLHYLPFSFSVQEKELIWNSYKVPYALTEYIEWLHQQSGPVALVAVEAVTQLINTQLFTDGNLPRTALLLLNVLLIQAQYPLVHIKDEDNARYVALIRQANTLESKRALEDLLLYAIESTITRVAQSISPQKPNSQTLLKIGQLAELTGQTVPTIRFWTKQGLIPVADHSQGGYQLYEKEQSLSLVLRIRAMQTDKRLTIHEIKKMLDT